MTAERSLRDDVERMLGDHPDGLLPIVGAGHPVLRNPAASYTGQLGAVLPDLLEWMRRTMIAAPGVGLAAPQVGIPLAIAVLWDPSGPEEAEGPRERVAVPHRTLINPRYEPVGVTPTAPAERRAFYEGCLSVPGFHAVVARHRAVRLTGQDESGALLDEVLVGWPARIVQHETDHLRGELYLDHAEIRSLATTDSMGQFWAREAVPLAAARILGFPLEH